MLAFLSFRQSRGYFIDTREDIIIEMFEHFEELSDEDTGVSIDDFIKGLEYIKAKFQKLKARL